MPGITCRRLSGTRLCSSAIKGIGINGLLSGCSNRVSMDWSVIRFVKSQPANAASSANTKAEEQIRLREFVDGRCSRKFIVDRTMPDMGSKKYDEMKSRTDYVISCDSLIAHVLLTSVRATNRIIEKGGFEMNAWQRRVKNGI